MSIARFAAPVVALALAGCASTAPVVSSDDTVDTAYVNAVNRVALARGLQVVWMRYPTKSEKRQ